MSNETWTFWPASRSEIFRAAAGRSRAISAEETSRMPFLAMYSSSSGS